MSAATTDIHQFLVEAGKTGLKVVRLGRDETALIPFRSDGEVIPVHYCEEPEVRGYVPCAGEGCLLCEIGRESEKRLLLPMYLPAQRTVEVLSLSMALRPGALLPQLADILDSEEPATMFVKRTTDNQFVVSTRTLKPDMDCGENAVQKFEEACAAGEIELASVYPARSRDQLRHVEAIAREMEIRGIEA